MKTREREAREREMREREMREREMGHDRCIALGGIRISDRLRKHLWEVTGFLILTAMVNKPINK